MEKTIRQWLEELPNEEYRTKALSNYDSEFNEEWREDAKDKIFESSLDALGDAFNWDESPEGYIYWGDYADLLDNKQI